MIDINEPVSGVAEVLINDPPRNLVDTANGTALRGALSDIDQRSDIRAVVITGAGDNFSMGDDIKEFSRLLDRGDELAAKLQFEHELMNEITALSKPTIAAIDGYCLGGGLELAVTCDFRVAASSAKLGYPEVKIGGFPAGNTLARLPRIVGQANALWLCLFGEIISAQKAESLGLIHECVDANTSRDRAHELATTLSERSTHSIAAMRQGLANAGSMNEADAVAFVRTLSEKVFYGPDVREGINAFLEKRRPAFQ